MKYLILFLISGDEVDAVDMKEPVEYRGGLEEEDIDGLFIRRMLMALEAISFRCTDEALASSDKDKSSSLVKSSTMLLFPKLLADPCAAPPLPLRLGDIILNWAI